MALRTNKTKEEKRAYYLKHRERLLAKSGRNGKIYRQSLKGKEAGKRKDSKRKTKGFVPINRYFNGADAHHIDSTRVIYIPKDIHQTIQHNVTSGVGMAEINYHAFNWLEAEGMWRGTPTCRVGT